MQVSERNSMFRSRNIRSICFKPRGHSLRARVLQRFSLVIANGYGDDDDNNCNARSCAFYIIDRLVKNWSMK